WWRTIPPYLAALAIAYLAVFFSRHQPFDFNYLVFLQNYEPQLPFFLASWSLCVEEHFYLFVPVIALLLAKSGNQRFLFLTCLLPMVFRSLEAPAEAPGFGYFSTASHLNLDGLLGGFSLSYYWGDPARRPAWLPAAGVATIVVAAGLLVSRLAHPISYVLNP